MARFYVRRKPRRVLIRFRRTNNLRGVVVERDGMRSGSVRLPARMTVEQYCRDVPRALEATAAMLFGASEQGGRRIS